MEIVFLNKCEILQEGAFRTNRSLKIMHLPLVKNIGKLALAYTKSNNLKIGDLNDIEFKNSSGARVYLPFCEELGEGALCGDHEDKVMFIHPHQVTALRKDTNFISNDKYNMNVMLKGEIGMIANTRIVPSRKAVNDEGTYYLNPIVQLKAESQTGDSELAAVTVFMKRNVNVETERHTLNRTTDISVDEVYVAALTDESKVVVAKFPVSGNPSL